LAENRELVFPLIAAALFCCLAPAGSAEVLLPCHGVTV